MAKPIIPTDALLAARKYGPLVDQVAAGYRNPLTGQPLSGTALLLKLGSGESGFNMGAVSSANAKGDTQFTPGSRNVAIQKYGIDPWRSVDEAFHGAALHLLGKINGSKGLEGYNPGDPSYTNYILGQRVGSTGASGAPEAGAVGSGAAGGGGAGVSPLLKALLEQKPAVQSAGLASPAVSAAPTLAAGYQAPVGGGGPAPKTDIQTLLDLAASSQGSDDGSSTGSGTGAVSGDGGEIKVADGANRAGVGLTPGIQKVLRAVSAVAGQPLTVGTGTNHNQMTVNGNESDHWTGNAADVPATGKDLVRLGQDALIAAGMPEAQARKQTGGLFNVPYGKNRRIQIIFNTHEGGDHTNHLHVGVTGLR